MTTEKAVYDVAESCPPTPFDGVLQSGLTGRSGACVFATTDAGIPDDGTEVSSQVQQFLQANKGKTLVFESGCYQFAGVTLEGAGWESTTLIFQGRHRLSPNADGSNNYRGGWGGLILGDNVSDLTLWYRGDGNRLQQPDREHIFNIVIHGARNITIPFAEISEIRGDGIYVTRHVSRYTNTQNLWMGYVNVYNREKDGRNGVSITSCDGGHIDYFRSENVGGVVGGKLQPGGLDLEPNVDASNTFLIRDFTVNSAVAINAGSVGVGLVGQADAMRIKNCHIRHACVRQQGSVRMTGCQDSSVTGVVEAIDTGTASIVSAAQRCVLDINVVGAGFAAQVGIHGNVKDSTINVRAAGITNSGVIVAAAENCRFDLTLSGFDKSRGNSNYIGLWFRNPNSNPAPIVRDCTFTVSCPASSGAIRALNGLTTDAVPVQFVGVNKLTPDSRFPDYPDLFSVTGNVGDKLTKAPGIPGLTWLSALPKEGLFRAGDRGYCASPQSAVWGWVRLTTGASHRPGVDWRALVCTGSETP